MKTSQVRAALALLQWDVERLALAADIDPNRLKVMLATQGEFTSLKIDGEYITDGLHAEMKIHKALTLRGIKFINDWENPGVVLQIGRAHVGTPVTNAHLVVRLLLEYKFSLFSSYLTFLSLSPFFLITFF